MKRVSVVVPSYNHEAFILDALRSAAEQSYPELEIVVVDDGSSDRSASLVEAFARCSARPVKLVTQANAGAHAAIERGISLASGEVIAILNSDDVYDRDRIARIMAAAEGRESFIAFTELEYIGADGRPVGPADPNPAWYRRMLRAAETAPGIGFGLTVGNFAVSSSNFVFDRKYHERVGPFAPYRLAHDLDFLLRGAFDSEPLFLKETLLRYRLHGANTTNSIRDIGQDELSRIFTGFFSTALRTEPRNRLAPGSRHLMLYFSYVLQNRVAWFSGRTYAETTGVSVPPERIRDATPDDARALLAECRLLAEALAAKPRHLDRVSEPVQQPAQPEELGPKNARLAAELASARELVRLRSATDYGKLVVFWPAGWLLRRTAAVLRPLGTRASDHMHRLAELVDERRYRAFVKQLGIDLVRAGEIIVRPLVGSSQRLAGGRSRRPEAPSGSVSSETTAAAQTATETARFEGAPPSASRLSVFIVGASSPDAVAATRASVASQTLAPSTVGEVVDRATLEAPPDELVLLVAAGARLDSTAAELLAAAFVSVPGCTFAAATAADAAGPTTPGSVVAALALGRLWREYVSRHGDLTDTGLGTVLGRLPGPGVVLPIPLATLDAGATVGGELPAMGVHRLAPDTWVWPASPIEGAARLHALIGATRAGGDPRPHLMVVVPGLPVGGSEVVLLDVLKHLAATWAISIVTMLPGSHAMRSEFSKITGEIYHPGDIFEPFRLQAMLSGLIDARNTRAVLSSNSGSFHRMLPELKAAHPGVAFVDVQHNDMPNGLIGGAVEASASLDKHVVVSTRIAEALARRGVPRQKIALIANGVDTDLFRPPADRSHARVALGIDPKALVLAFVGRFSAEKRVQAYAQIVSLVREKLPVRGLAVGEGEDKPILQALIAAQDLPIEVLEPMERSQLRTIYAAADVLVLPSEVEGMPMAVLEAMATGCPVAVTDVGDLRRIIEQGTSGFIAPVEAPERLAEMIVEAARERGRLDSMRAAARQAVVSSGTTSWAMQQEYQELLASVAAIQA